ITVHVVHSPDVRTYLTSMKEQFEASRPKLQDGREIRVELINEFPLAAARRIAHGELKTEGWLSPATSLVNYANGELANLGPRQKDCRQLFATPVVVAVPSQTKDFFGTQDNKFSWNEFFDSKLGSESNAQQGSSNVSFVHGSPLYSVSG